jgi:hypothetical protein
LAIVVGANIGIGVTSFIAGFSQIDTRRMGLGILLMKLVGAVVIVPLMPWVVRLLEPLSLEDENHRLQAELAILLAARRDNDETGRAPPSSTPSPRRRTCTWHGRRSERTACQHAASKDNIAQAILDP